MLKSFETEAINKISILNTGIQNALFKLLWVTANSKKSNANLRTYLHHHTFYEIHFVKDGFVKYAFEDENITVDGGRFLVIPPCKAHEVMEYADEFMMLTVALEVEEGTDFERALNHFSSGSVKSSDKIKHLMENALEEVGGKNDYRDEIISLILHNIIYCIASESAVKRAKNAESSDKNDVRVVKAKKYINDNANIFFSCEEVANHCNISSKHLNRIFLRFEKMGLLAYIHANKIERAKKLLADKTKSQKQIAFELGFSNVQYFNRFFARNTGVTPGEFQKTLN